MKTVQEVLMGAEQILVTERNLEPSLAWLRANGLDAPDFAPRCLHS